jgi:hypothetical protein
MWTTHVMPPSDWEEDNDSAAGVLAWEQQVQPQDVSLSSAELLGSVSPDMDLYASSGRMNRHGNGVPAHSSSPSSSSFPAAAALGRYVRADTASGSQRSRAAAVKLAMASSRGLAFPEECDQEGRDSPYPQGVREFIGQPEQQRVFQQSLRSTSPGGVRRASPSSARPVRARPVRVFD